MSQCQYCDPAVAEGGTLPSEPVTFPRHFDDAGNGQLIYDMLGGAWNIRVQEGCNGDEIETAVTHCPWCGRDLSLIDKKELASRCRRIRLDNDKFALRDWTQSDLSALADELERDLGITEYPEPAFEKAIAGASTRIGTDIEDLRIWDIELGDNLLDVPADDYVWTSLWHLCVLTYTQTDMGWDESIEDVFSQLSVIA